MAKFSYVGQRYRQGSSHLELVSFCASANDIRAWGGVPAKTERFHGGFQRALSDRSKKIKAYFDDGQASPTSIVVAFREGTLKVTPMGYPAAWTDDSKLSLAPEFVHLTFETDIDDDDAYPISELRIRVAALLKPRLEKSQSQSDNDPTSDESAESQEDIEASDSENENGIDDDVDETSPDISEEAESQLDVGHSKLRAFYEFISSDERIDEWLKAENSKYADLSVKSKKNTKEQEFLRYKPEERLRYILLSLLRPAMIVDGQHRVFGAYDSDQSPIVFSICAIKDADWVEQVFQFVVLNKLAKPISPSFLTSILNTSLTNAEVHEIETRLDTIGIRNTDRMIVKYLNLDEKSPFYGLIAEPSELAGIDNEGKLSDKGMIRLAKRWRNVVRNKKDLQMFLPALGVTSVTAARKEWDKYEVWTKYFFAFWAALKARYAKEGIWEKKPGFHLLYIVTMQALQDMFLDAKSEGDNTFKDLADFEKQVVKYFEAVPATFFQGWLLTGLQSGDGPAWIKKAVGMFRDGKKLAAVKEESELFKKS